MTTKKTYGPWIKWHGGECPVPPETLVEIRYRSGVVASAYAAYLWWRHGIGSGDIVEYRTVTEQPDLDAAEQLLRDNGYTITPPAKPLTFEDVVPMTEIPPEGTEFWVIAATSEEGAYRTCWVDGNELDLRTLKRRMAYLDEEHALIAARHIFGLKGGEL